MKKIFISILLVTSLFSNDLDSFSDEYSEIKNNEIKNNSYLYKYNVMMTEFNDFVDAEVLYPVSKRYKNTVDEELRVGFDNMYKNINFPQRFVNNLLQLKFTNSFIEISRFTINTTLGFFGFKDVRKHVFNLERKNEDFGQTLGYYNIGSGAHIVLPLLGPSNVRDIVGLSFDYLVVPNATFDDSTVEITSKVFKTVNNKSLNLEVYNNLKKDAITLQPYLESVYEDYRNKQIKE